MDEQRSKVGPAGPIADYFPIWVVTLKPRDFPDHVVVREHRVVGRLVLVARVGCLHDSLGDARLELAARGLVRIDRHPGDDPVIVETWL